MELSGKKMQYGDILRHCLYWKRRMRCSYKQNVEGEAFKFNRDGILGHCSSPERDVKYFNSLARPSYLKLRQIRRL